MLAEVYALILQVEESLCITSGGKHFLAIANDAFVKEDFFQFFVSIPGHLFGIEAIEHRHVSFLATQDRDPAESSLGAIQNELGVQGFRIIFRDSPDGVMIMDIQGV